MECTGEHKRYLPKQKVKNAAHNFQPKAISPFIHERIALRQLL
jgi:hypothetical protein